MTSEILISVIGFILSIGGAVIAALCTNAYNKGKREKEMSVIKDQVEENEKKSIESDRRLGEKLEEHKEDFTKFKLAYTKEIEHLGRIVEINKNNLDRNNEKVSSSSSSLQDQINKLEAKIEHIEKKDILPIREEISRLKEQLSKNS